MSRALFARPLACLLCAATMVLAQSGDKVYFLTFEEAAPVVNAMKGGLPSNLADALPLSSKKWAVWVHSEDGAIRARLDRGEEDTLTNLLRFGVTYTKERRVYDEDLFRYGKDATVDQIVENRVNDLVKTMASGSSNEGIEEMRTFLEKKGFSFKNRSDTEKIKAYLLTNLSRMRDEILLYISQQGEHRFQLFEDRGISLDTNLWPDFLIDQHLQLMLRDGLLQKGSIQRVAIVGPGLDFANKEKGNDFYPPQTVQPFAVLDSLFRLGLASPNSIELYTLDISPDVNLHIARAKKDAMSGKPYIIQLPWNTSARLAPDYRGVFVRYWSMLGSSLGQPVTPIPVPAGAAAETQTRAVKIRPEILQRITPLDTNIVFQHLALAPDRGFDLIIGTNIFVYFSGFEQALARKNMSLMLKPGGFVLSNDKLPGTPRDGLLDSLQSSLTVARDPYRTEYMFSYKRQK